MSWKSHLLSEIHGELSPNEFEDFIYVLFENMGFSDLELTKRSRDGGVDLRATWTQSQVPGLEIDLNFVIQVKRYNPNTPLSIKILRELRGVIRAGEWGLIVTTGRVSPNIRAFGLDDSSRIISVVDGSQLVDLCVEYEVGVKKEFQFDPSFLRNTIVAEPQIEASPVTTPYPRDLSSILSLRLDDSFKKIGNLPLYSGSKLTLIGRWSQRYENQGLDYWYGLKARDLQIIKQHPVTHFAYVCANEGVVLLPKDLVLKHVDAGNLTKSPKTGNLIHYHMKFRNEKNGLIWIVSQGILENVEEHYVRAGG